MTAPFPPNIVPAARSFSGRIVFHQRARPLVYDLTVTNGVVTGSQHFGEASESVATVVGGWFEFKTGKLSLLIQGSDSIDFEYRTQAQQFRVDPKSKEVTLEHMLFGDGLTLETTKLLTSHVLDSLKRA